MKGPNGSHGNGPRRQPQLHEGKLIGTEVPSRPGQAKPYGAGVVRGAGLPGGSSGQHGGRHKQLRPHPNRG